MWLCLKHHQAQCFAHGWEAEFRLTLRASVDSSEDRNAELSIAEVRPQSPDSQTSALIAQDIYGLDKIREEGGASSCAVVLKCWEILLLRFSKR